MTINGIATINFPCVPGTKNMGAKETIVVSTPNTTGTHTSLVPSMAPVTPCLSLACLLSMFSATTIASSTTMPSTKMNARSEIMLIVTSKAGISAKAPMNETGMPIATHNASLRRMNRAKTTKTSKRPDKAFSTSRRVRLRRV